MEVESGIRSNGLQWIDRKDDSHSITNIASIKSFEDIIAWQKARTLSVEAYSKFRQNRDFGFRDQVQRAAVSVMNNIAEGFERKGDKEFGNFLSTAKGSCGEVRSMLTLALDLGYISEEDLDRLSVLAVKISKIPHVIIVRLDK